MKNKTRLIIIVLGIIIGLSLSVLGFKLHVISKTLNTNKIYAGINIEGINVSDLNQQDAVVKMQEVVGNILKDKTLTLKCKDKSMVLHYNDIVSSDGYEMAVNQAFSKGRAGNVFSRYNEVKKFKTEPVDIKINYILDKNKVRENINKFKEQIDRQPLDATMEKDKLEPFKITKEQTGINLDVDYTIDRIKEGLSNKVDEVEVIVNVVQPKILEKDLLVIQNKIGEFKTRFNSSNISRSTNLKVATNNIDGTILNPGEIFSVNEYMKPRTAANGYKKAHIIVNGKYIDGYGGGVCQVATTLYNAVLLADLEVIERRSHSLKSSYVNVGRDATVSGNAIDFKFKNNTENRIYIQGYIEGRYLHYNIFGTKDHLRGDQVKFEYVVTSRKLPPPEKIIEDSSMLVGQKKVIRRSKEGMVVKLYRMIYNNGKLVVKEQVNQSYYRPVRAEIKVGTKPVPVQDVMVNANQPTVNQNVENENNVIENQNNNIDTTPNIPNTPNNVEIESNENIFNFENNINN